MVESAPNEEIDQKLMVIKHDSKEYHYVRILGRGGCGMVCEYKNEETSHRMAVKFETLKTATSLMYAEEHAMTNLWRRNSNLRHFPRFYGSYCLP